MVRIFLQQNLSLDKKCDEDSSTDSAHPIEEG